MENEDFQVIKTIDENGEEINLKLLDIVTVNDTDYALLLPDDVNLEEDEESEVVLMKLKQDDADYIFETIEDDEEFDMVAQAIMECE